MKDQISRAELICYPMGSFYSSIVANLLPAGVGLAVAANRCPKVFVPNTASDCESPGMTVAEQVETLLSYLVKDDPQGMEPKDVLDFVILDEDEARYEGGVDEKRLQKAGIETIRCSLVSSDSEPLIDANRLASVILSLP
jgi:2-phospho-L-lactate transferase/gluconeogenesis factor (CofD/UPF0052 family)